MDASATETFVIQTQNLTKQFGAVTAVDALSLNISASTIFGLVGPNGAGKSTTVNVLTGILKPTSGRATILGMDINERRTDIKRHIGVVPEGMALFEGLKGREQLVFVSKIFSLSSSDTEKRIEELLSVLELKEASDRLIESYSQGMKKKLAFACAIIHAPNVLFLDEPFENVDPISRKVMKDILATMKSNGATICLTSHALEMVEDFCVEVAIINKGKLVFQARTEDIRKKIKDEVGRETRQSLEEIFIDVVSETGKPQLGRLSWL